MADVSWDATRIEAATWWCGDEHCDCTQPQITRITPNRVAGPPWIRREVLWQGEFISCTYELDSADLELRRRAPGRAACAEFGVPVPDDWMLRG